MPVLLIAPGNDAVIAAMIQLPREGVAWRLEQSQQHERWIDIRYRARGGAWAIVRLLAREHPAPPKTFSSRVTESMRLVVLRSSPNAELRVLLDVLTTQVRAHEQDFRWVRQHEPAPLDPRTPRDIDPEQLAFEAGIKPAMRLRLAPWECPYPAGIWLRAGACLAMVVPDTESSRGWNYLMIAHTRAHAEALADAELRQYVLHLDDVDAVRDCGELLGYPRCCVDAFVNVKHDVGSDVDGRLANFHRVDRAWVPAPHPHLNMLAIREKLGLLSFDPCSFACPAALAIADRIAAVTEAALPGYCAHLRGVFAINQADDRVALTLDDDRRVLAARPTHVEAEPFAARIVGHVVDDQGRVPTLAEPCRVFEFA